MAVAGRAPERAILTSAPESERPALADLRRALPTGSPVKLSPGLLLVRLPGTFTQFAQRLRDSSPLFIRHIQPVQMEVRLAGDAGDPDLLTEAALEFAGRLDSGRSFSVQTRLLPTTAGPAPDDETPAHRSRFAINERLSAALSEATGAPLDVRRPCQVLSVLLTPTVGYLGLSEADENLSSWAGGAIRFSREPEQISRAEFKLLEALELFRLELPEHGRALDLGAAPGGWTRILRRAGLEVVAVDPGELDPRLQGDPGIHHLRATAQEYRCQADEFAVIVNDMRMDARDSARLMLGFTPCLDVGGWAVMTLKLPERSPDAVAHQAIGLLLRRFNLQGARQLYHNRSEITVALTRRVREQRTETAP